MLEDRGFLVANTSNGFSLDQFFRCQGALVLMEGVSQYLHPTSSTKTPGVLSLCLRAPAPASRHEAGREPPTQELRAFCGCCGSSRCGSKVPLHTDTQSSLEGVFRVLRFEGSLRH